MTTTWREVCYSRRRTSASLFGRCPSAARGALPARAITAYPGCWEDYAELGPRRGHQPLDRAPDGRRAGAEGRDWSSGPGTGSRDTGWCEERDSNPHARGHRLLRPARLPVPPSSHLASRSVYLTEGVRSRSGAGRPGGETVPGTVCRDGPQGAAHKRFLAPFPPLFGSCRRPCNHAFRMHNCRRLSPITARPFIDLWGSSPAHVGRQPFTRRGG